MHNRDSKEEYAARRQQNKVEMIQMVGEGLTYKEISKKLRRSWRTVDGDILRMRQKHGATNTINLVSMAVKKD